MRLLLCLLVCFTPLSLHAEGRFLAMSDIHFDPIGDPTMIDRLAAAPAAEWADLLAGGPRSGFGKDTDWTLLNQMLDKMREVEPHPMFLLMPGDFLAHRLDTRFKQAGARDDGAFLAFEAKTLQVIVQQTQQRFPGVPILPVLGNNDDSCGDYRGTDGDATMSTSLPIIRAMLGGDPGGGFATDWARLGSYDVALPGVPGTRLIGFDNVFFSAHYKPCAPAPDTIAPDAALLGWLHDRLEAARQGGSKVWLMMHIPPGTDVFGTLMGAACPAPPAQMWQAADLTAYTGLIDEFADVIVAQFAGHTHMNEFRLIGAKGFIMGVPAVSPIYLQNPAFDLFSIGADGGLSDRRTYALANFADMTKPAAPAPQWHAESFDEASSLGTLDGGSLRQLASRLTGRPPRENPDLGHYLLAYTNFHVGVWAAQNIDMARAARTIACAAAENSPASFSSCNCP